MRWRLLLCIAAAMTLGGLAGCGSDSNNNNGASAAPAQIVPLSNRADLVSGGSAMVEIVMPNPQASGLKVDVGGRDVTSAFAVRSDGRIKGVITGLATGDNVVTASATGVPAGRLTLTNHPIGGPVLLGSQATPWVCATPVAVAAVGNTPASNASGLTTNAVDVQCNIATEFKLFYRTTNPCSTQVLPDPSPAGTPTPANSCFQPFTIGSTPADLATTTTPAGTVPYIVRVERGTLNRGIYDIAVLFDTTKPWTATAPQAQWNGKVVYSFGASTGQPRQQFRSEQNWADDVALSLGFMVVDNSVTDSLFNSNRILVAETLMMMKQHIVDNYGEIKYTVGNGCSGGSIQQNTVASTFPGLLDGIQPSCDYPDSITTGIEVTDCVLLVNAYVSPPWTALMAGLTQAQIDAKKTAINGHFDATSCHGWYNSFGTNNKPGNFVPTFVINPAGAIAAVPPAINNCKLPAGLVYDPVTNPNGTRCGDPDLSAAVWGTTAGIAAGSTRALSTNDNVGVQYGLNALLSAAITPEEFVTLNETIGGVDADSNPTAARSVADLPALDIAYKAGIVSSGKNLAKLPIIDSRGFDEAPPPVGAFGIHYIWRSFSERARIDTDNTGNHGNQVMWRYGTGLLPGLSPPASAAAQFVAVTVRSFLTMDAWLSSLLTSAPKASLNAVRTQAQVIAAKPATAVDFCFLTGDDNFTTPIFDQTVCDADARLAKHSSPHQVAGGPLNENILKCQLKPLVAADYPGITFTAAQLTRLNTVFPTGVCDWSKPGVGQQDPISPLTFAAGPGGQPLGPPPVSQGM
jgi:hypothetical protein